jgi:hypothetical protein
MFARSLRIFALLALCSAGGFAETKPDPTEVSRELGWLYGDYPAFEKLMERAKAAELPEVELLLPQLDASLLFGDLPKLKEFLPKTEAAKAEIIKKKGGTEDAREEVVRSIKLGKQFLAFAEKRPAEVARRAEMFRMVLYAHQTIEDARMLDAAVDQFAIEKNVGEGSAVTWEQIRPYLPKTTQLYATGGTIFGDKFGPFIVGTTPAVPRESYHRLKDYLPAEAWEGFTPK